MRIIHNQIRPFLGLTCLTEDFTITEKAPKMNLKKNNSCTLFRCPFRGFLCDCKIFSNIRSSPRRRVGRGRCTPRSPRPQPVCRTTCRCCSSAQTRASSPGRDIDKLLSFFSQPSASLTFQGLTPPRNGESSKSILTSETFCAVHSSGEADRHRLSQL